MASFNKVILLGNLTRDPELRYTSKGMAIAKLGLAVNRTWKDETGNPKEETTFVDIDAFGRQAELIGQYLRKGQPLFVEGRLRLDTWEDKQTNQKRNRLGVVLENFQFIGPSNRASEEGGAPPMRSAAAPPPPAPKPADPNPAPPDHPNPEEDDVPF